MRDAGPGISPQRRAKESFQCFDIDLPSFLWRGAISAPNATAPLCGSWSTGLGLTRSMGFTVYRLVGNDLVLAIIASRRPSLAANSSGLGVLSRQDPASKFDCGESQCVALAWPREYGRSGMYGGTSESPSLNAFGSSARFLVIAMANEEQWRVQVAMNDSNGF